ncbi:MAG TPA: hypothetical protein PKA64_20630, partial [Myxococcota bacterium]|nr:hypothetical protein [Myxococcota bacterium]
VCLDLRRPQLVGTSRVGADHRARLSGTLPGRLAVGQRLRWQAVVGAAPLLSQTQVTPVRAGGLDEDGDGLSNAVEARRGLRGDRLDTDFGGVDDRQEGVVDHTDPTDPRDDVPGERLCADGVDNDGDLRADCLDPDCVASCPEGACADGVDDNFDGWTDCADPTCAVDPACFEVACADGLDSDGDGLTDCADPDCHVGTTGYCRERSCGDGRDEDLDGLVDCADEDCDLVVPCLERCWNQRDDNGDGLIDCADRDCASACHERQCADGRDDDGDALVDCEDGDCAFDAACFEQACDDGVDQDHDGAVDCDDPDCWDGRCHDHVLSWLVSGHVEASLYGYWGALYGQTEATGVTGRVRVVGPRVGTLTCTFSVQRAALGSSSVREGVTMDPACEVDERALPALGPRLADGAWYGPWVTRETSVIRRGYVPGPNTVTYVHAVSGPAQEGAPRGACGGGLSPVPMYRDLDGDGFGVSGVDRLGLPGGRVMVCGPPGPGLVAQAGDCDDGDPGWSPATVALAPGRGCTDVRPTDLDGDGYPRGVDQDDRDGGKH